MNNYNVFIKFTKPLKEHGDFLQVDTRTLKEAKQVLIDWVLKRNIEYIHIDKRISSCCWQKEFIYERIK